MPQNTHSARKGQLELLGTKKAKVTRAIQRKKFGLEADSFCHLASPQIFSRYVMYSIQWECDYCDDDKRLSNNNDNKDFFTS